jgi:hypothetical protein
MDSSTKQRYISTSIWSDEWFDTLSIQEKLIYFHLLTNEFTNAAGVYHFSLKQIRIDLDISRDEVNAAMEKFEAAGKAYYYREYVVIPKWLKHQKISERNTIFLGVIKILRSLPDEIRRFIADRKHYDFPVEKYVKIPSIDGPSPVEDGPPPEKAWPIPEKGVAHAKNTENSAHDLDLDLDSDLDSDLDIKSGGGLKAIASREEVPPEKPPPQTTTAVILKIQETAKKAGFNITADVARSAVNSGPDPGWLSGGFNFLEYAARFIRGAYPEKPDPELRRLFITAIGGRGEPPWDNLLDEYPAWRKKQEAAAAAEAAAREAERLKRDPPETCPGCGGPVKDRVCSRCRGHFRFREDPPGWEFLPHRDGYLSEGFRKIRRGEVPEPVPADPVF